ncbi:MAG: hypothetical protein WKG07_46965 [Hymenobacter sp.]
MVTPERAAAEKLAAALAHGRAALTRRPRGAARRHFRYLRPAATFAAMPTPLGHPSPACARHLPALYPGVY